MLLVDALQEMGHVQRRDLQAIAAAMAAHDRCMSCMLEEARQARPVGLLKRVAGVPAS